MPLLGRFYLMIKICLNPEARASHGAAVPQCNRVLHCTSPNRLCHRASESLVWHHHADSDGTVTAWNSELKETKFLEGSSEGVVLQTPSRAESIVLCDCSRALSLQGGGGSNFTFARSNFTLARSNFFRVNCLSKCLWLSETVKFHNLLRKAGSL